MNVQQTKKEKGFTIIEVVLVLAIAGLIFLMVFIALPALQRGQRDQQRRNDLGRAQTAVQAFQSNNRNRLPENTDQAWNDNFKDDYLEAEGDTFEDPNRGPYEFEIRGNVDIPDYDSESAVIYVTRGYTCNGETLTDSGVNKVALRMKLEGGGTACVNN